MAQWRVRLDRLVSDYAARLEIGPGVGIAIPITPADPLMWWHICKIDDREEGRWVLGGLSKHDISMIDPGVYTVRPSIMCLRCQRHGFITENVWREA